MFGQVFANLTPALAMVREAPRFHAGSWEDSLGPAQGGSGPLGLLAS